MKRKAAKARDWPGKRQRQEWNWIQDFLQVVHVKAGEKGLTVKYGLAGLSTKASDFGQVCGQDMLKGLITRIMEQCQHLPQSEDLLLGTWELIDA